MNRQRFLLWFLAAIFASQMIVFGTFMAACWTEGGTTQCPQIATRYEETFALWISVTLALLTGVNMNKKEPEKRE